MFRLTDGASALMDLARDDAEQRGAREFGMRHVVVAALDLGSEGPLAPVFHIGRDAELRVHVEEGMLPRPATRRLHVAAARVSTHLDMHLRMATARAEVSVRRLLELCLDAAAMRRFSAAAGMTKEMLLELADEETVPRAAQLPAESVAAPPGGGSTRPADALASFGRDLTALAKDGKLRGAVGRDEEVKRLRAALNRMNQNNPLLVGLPGTGKTAVVEELAVGVAAGRWSDLNDTRIVELDLAGMVAGTKYRGEFEQRLKSVIDAVRAADGALIPFIDEIHLIVGAGGAEGSMDAANILKPPLARGELRVIGATTPSEYRQSIEKDPALARRFQPVSVDPPSVEDTRTIVHAVVPAFTKHHGVDIDPAAADAAVHLADRYLTDRQFPDKALFLLDEAAAYARVEDADITRLREPHMLVAVERVTGVPVHQLRKGHAERLASLDRVLRERVLGQREAVDLAQRRISEAHTGLAAHDRPMPGLLFVGPSGVGKTHLARVIADEYFGTPGSFQRFDMSQYAGHAGHASLLGAPMGTVGATSGGALTNALRRHPHALYLFDEIEKGDRDVLNIFLGILDSGKVVGRDGVEIDCRHALFAFTSNLGAAGDDTNAPWTVRRDYYTEVLSTHLPPELVGRMDVVPFNAITEDSAAAIVRTLFAELTAQAKRGAGVELELDDAAATSVAREGLDATYGARALRRAVDERVKRPLVDWMLARSDVRGRPVRSRWSEDGGTMTYELAEVG